MLSFYSCSTNSVAMLAIASLAWFVIGILAGRVLVPAKAQRSRKTPRRGSGAGNQRSQAPRNPASIKGNPELYVGNLSYDVTEKDIYSLLGEFGSVSSVRLIENSFNGKSKGYAFVQMGNRASSDKVTKALNNKEHDGRKMVVNIAKNRAR